MDYKNLWIELYDFFLNENQTNWGKNQIRKIMEDMELEEARKE